MRGYFSILLLLSLSMSCRDLSFLVPDTDPTADDGLCVEGNPSAAPVITSDGLYAEFSGETGTANGITSYLNAGGGIEQLQEELAGIRTSSSDRIKAQVMTLDVTGDSIPDVTISLVLPTMPGYGDAILATFACQDHQYVRHGLFGRTGAGSRGEDLYDSGGARIQQIRDLNSDGIPEILFHVASLGELHIVEWDGRGFASLVQYSDGMGNSQTYIPAREGSFTLEDRNNDGTLEIVVTDSSALKVWMWDGNHFQPEDK